MEFLAVWLAYVGGGVSANTIPACFRHAIRSLIVGSKSYLLGYNDFWFFKGLKINDHEKLKSQFTGRR